MAHSTWPDGSEIRRWLAVDETATEMLRSVRERNALTITPMPPLHNAPLHGRNVLEIAGPSGSGKSELLLQSAVTCILPKQWEGIPLGGSEKSVLYIDLDGRFEMRRLVHLLECRISKAESGFYDMAWDMFEAGSGQTVHKGREKSSNSVKQASVGKEFRGTSAPESAEASTRTGRTQTVWEHGGSAKMLIRTCLQRFHLKRCHSDFDFLVTIKTLRAKFYGVELQHGATVELLIMDSIGAFYWLERSTRSPAAQSSRIVRTTAKTLNLWTVADAIVAELRRIIELHPKVLIMATKILILKKWGGENSSFWKGADMGGRNSTLPRDVIARDNWGSTKRVSVAVAGHRMGTIFWAYTERREIQPPGHRKIPENLFNSNKYLAKITTEESSGHHDFLPASWRGFVTHRIVLRGPYQSDLAPIDRFLCISPSFFTAEWEKPSSESVDFFVIKDDGIKLVN